MDQELARHARMTVSTPTEDDAAEGTSCDCPDPDPSPSGVCGRCLRLMWQSPAHPAQAWVRDVPPVPGTLVCPVCGKPHVDEGEWATRPHRRHLCVNDAQGAGCGATWEIGLMLPGVGWLRMMGVPAAWAPGAAAAPDAATAASTATAPDAATAAGMAPAGTGLPAAAGEAGDVSRLGAVSAPAAESGRASPPGRGPAPAANPAGSAPPVAAPAMSAGGYAGHGAPGVRTREVSFGARGGVVRR